MIQIMVSYTTTIFTLADTNILNLDKFTCLIFGVTPFLAAFFFLIGTHLTEETEMQIKLDTNQLLWITSILIALIITYITYLLHASSHKAT